MKKMRLKEILSGRTSSLKIRFFFFGGGGIFLGTSGTQASGYPGQKLYASGLFGCFRQGVAGMSRLIFVPYSLGLQSCGRFGSHHFRFSSSNFRQPQQCSSSHAGSSLKPLHCSKGECRGSDMSTTCILHVSLHLGTLFPHVV